MLQSEGFTRAALASVAYLSPELDCNEEFPNITVRVVVIFIRVFYFRIISLISVSMLHTLSDTIVVCCGRDGNLINHLIWFACPPTHPKMLDPRFYLASVFFISWWTSCQFSKFIEHFSRGSLSTAFASV